ncbi:MAG: hypothetical protein LBN74_07585 [Prevotella sp.]|jgi:hypothetical protein|nr:hypothetical protein [Prevotella sp.]
MNTVNERLIFLLNEIFKGNVSEFARVTGVPQPTLNNIVGNRMSKPSADNLERIINSIKSLDANWLITGKGTMLRTEEAPGGVCSPQSVCGNVNTIGGNTSGNVSGNVIGENNVTHNYKSQCDHLQDLIDKMDIRMYEQTSSFQEQIKTFQEQIKTKDEYIRIVVKKTHDRNKDHETQMADIRSKNDKLIDLNAKLSEELSKANDRIAGLMDKLINK